MWETRYEYRVLVGKPEGKITAGKPGHKWKDSIKMDLKERKWACVN
jgi:hypothetical protein